MKSNISKEKIEELSKIFSLKVADKLERKEISLDQVNNLLVDFFNLLNSAKDSAKIKAFIDEI